MTIFVPVCNILLIQFLIVPVNFLILVPILFNRPLAFLRSTISALPDPAAPLTSADIDPIPLGMQFVNGFAMVLVLDFQFLDLVPVLDDGLVVHLLQLQELAV